MEEESASLFVSSLAKAIQSCCSGHIHFSTSIEVVGHLHLNIDRSVKLDYVVTEEVNKTVNNEAAFISHSYHSQPPPPRESSQAVTETCNCLDQVSHLQEDTQNSNLSPAPAPLISVSVPSDSGLPSNAAAMANLTVSLGPSPLLNIKQENSHSSATGSQDRLPSTVEQGGETSCLSFNQLPERFQSAMASNQGSFQSAMASNQGSFQSAPTSAHCNFPPSAPQARDTYLAAMPPAQDSLQLPISSPREESLQLQSSLTYTQHSKPSASVQRPDNSQQRESNALHAATRVMPGSQDIAQTAADHSRDSCLSRSSMQENERSIVSSIQSDTSSSIFAQRLTLSPGEENSQLSASSNSQVGSDYQHFVASSSMEHQPSSVAQTFNLDPAFCGLRVDVHNPGASVIHIKEEPVEELEEVPEEEPVDGVGSDYSLAEPSHMVNKNYLQSTELSSMLMETLGQQLLLLQEQGQQPFPVMLHSMPGVSGPVTTTLPSVSLAMPTSVRLGNTSPLLPSAIPAVSVPVASPASHQPPPPSGSGPVKRGRKRMRKNLKEAHTPHKANKQTSVKPDRKVAETKKKKFTLAKPESTKTEKQRAYKSSGAVKYTAVSKAAANKLLVPVHKTGFTKNTLTSKKMATSAKVKSIKTIVQKKPAPLKTDSNEHCVGSHNRHGLTHKVKRMVCRGTHTKDDIEAAIEQIHSGMSVIEAAWVFKIPLATLFSRSRRGCTTHAGRCSQVHSSPSPSKTVKSKSPGRPKKKTTCAFKLYRQEALDMAVRDIHSGTTIQNAATLYSIPKSTLYLRSKKGCPSHAGKCTMVSKKRT